MRLRAVDVGSLKEYIDLRNRLGAAHTMEDIIQIADEMKERLRVAESENKGA